MPKTQNTDGFLLRGESILHAAELSAGRAAEQLGNDLVDILRNVQTRYTIVYKGGPDNGFIEAGKQAEQKLWLLGARPIQGTKKMVIGEPKVGGGTKGFPQYLFDAMFRQHLDLNDCMRIYERAGMNPMELWASVEYRVESIEDDLIVMKCAGVVTGKDRMKERDTSSDSGPQSE